MRVHDPWCARSRHDAYVTLLMNGNRLETGPGWTGTHSFQVGFPLQDRLWMAGSHLEKPALRAVKPRSMWEYGAVMFAVQYTYFLDYVAGNDSVMKISYEQLLADTDTTLKRIFGYTLNLGC